jgi:uncharacterized protein (TIGR00661 family)
MRILYGVTGEGLGHAMRSRIVIAELLRRGHRVKVAASGRACGLLSQAFPDVVAIRGLRISYRDGTMARGRTVLDNLRAAPAFYRDNVPLYEAAIRGFDPELCVSDFDSFAHLYGKAHRVPVVAIDHQHVLDRCIHPREVRGKLSPGFGAARAFVRAKMPGCARYVVPSFYFPEVRRRARERTTLIAPILRDEVRRATPSLGDEVLVYQTSDSHGRLLAALESLPAHRFVIYGMKERPAPAHLRFARFDERAFVADLAASKAVIANGGFTTVSEALHLGKPVLSIPVQGQHEQELNAAWLEQLHYGARLPVASKEGIERFLDSLDAHRASLAAAPRPTGNEAVATLCDSLFSEVPS